MQLNTQEIKNVLNGKVEKLPSFNHGAASYLQRMPYLRLIYRQIKLSFSIHVVDIIKFLRGAPIALSKVANMNDTEQYAELLDLLLKRMNKFCDASQAKLIFFYHPSLRLNRDGTASPVSETVPLAAFKQACVENGIEFIDMTAPFLATYQNEYVLPHGFWNTAVGAGH